jgi:aminoglycoside phosphotransferase (APT) family kinase protein
MAEPTGFDVANVSAWLCPRVTPLAPPLRFTRLPGGHSNFTYRVDDTAGRVFVLRRPPLGDLLPTAHDMGREFTLISALWPTGVPVPEPLAYCDDKDVTGAEFYAMGWVEGRAIHTSADVEGYLSREARASTGPSFIDTLAALHSLDPDEVGLGQLGRRDAYVSRQLHRWYASWNASKNRDLPEVDRLHTFLVGHLPEQSRVSVVHGDPGLHNCRVASTGHIAAIVDWEISTIGDPMADLGYAINAWVETADELAGRDDPPTVLPGFWSRSQLLDRYAGRTGADLSRIGYYRCFNHWKSACILQGVYARYLHGQKDTEGVDVDGFPSRIDRSVALAAESAARLPA